MAISMNDVKTLVQEAVKAALQQTGAVASAEEAKVRSMDSLTKRITTFAHDPEAGLTFELWYSRYESIFDKDACNLDDAAKVRLLTQKLDQVAFRSSRLAFYQRSMRSWISRPQ